ncbi:MAG: serine protease [Actinobacteria bacterium]|nr:MAG: serine protease [Actinomycetota bacterium]
MEFLEQLEAAVAKVGERVGPSVVRIGKGFGRGNGVVTAGGQVLTNAHNLRGPETTVTFADGRVAVGTAAGVDLDGDLAVLTVDTGDAPAIPWEPGSAAAGGSAVFAVAATVGGGRRVTFGTVSAVGRAFRGPRGWRIGGSVEHTAPLGRGSSGSPIVDGNGGFLGINTNRLGDGFYLALPADAELKRRVDALARGEAPARPRLGVALAPPRAARELRRAVGLPDRDGLLIRGVEDDSPADRAGLKKGDLIVEAAGRSLATPDDLFDALENVSADGSLVLKVVRGTGDREVRVAFGGGRVEGSA